MEGGQGYCTAEQAIAFILLELAAFSIWGVFDLLISLMGTSFLFCEEFSVCKED
jgi:hypothetical protein